MANRRTHKFNKVQKIDILEAYLVCRKSCSEALAKLRTLWNDRFLKISPSTMRNTYKVFREYGAVEYQPKRTATARTQEKIAAIKEIAEKAAEEGRALSSRKMAAQSEISPMTAWRILRKDLGMKPYHLKLLHALNEDDFDRRIEFCDEILHRAEESDEFLNRIVWSDEAIFGLDQTVNRHNCVYWDSSNPQRHVSLDRIGSDKVMVWAGIWAEGRIGPYFFQRSVRGDTYLEMLEDFVFPKLSEQREDFGQHFIWMQDGAPPHYATIVRDRLDDTFDEWIGRRGTWDWAPRSPDLTPCDFYLWGHLKDKVFARNPRCIEELKQLIVEEFEAIPQEQIAKACRSVKERSMACIALEGAQLKLHKDYA